MGLYRTVMRGANKNKIKYSERKFLLNLARHISKLQGLVEEEVLEVSHHAYGLDPRVVTFLARKFETTIHRLLDQCNQMLTTDEFDKLKSKYRKSMTNMSGIAHYPYLSFPCGYLKAERTEEGLVFHNEWHEDFFRRVTLRQRPQYFNSPMFPWRTYWQLDNLTSFVRHALQTKIVFSLRRKDQFLLTSQSDLFSNLTRQAAVKMVLCGIAVMDDYRLRLLAGEFTCETPRAVLYQKIMEDSLRR